MLVLRLRLAELEAAAGTRGGGLGRVGVPLGGGGPGPVGNVRVCLTAALASWLATLTSTGPAGDLSPPAGSAATVLGFAPQVGPAAWRLQKLTPDAVGPTRFALPAVCWCRSAPVLVLVMSPLHCVVAPLRRTLLWTPASGSPDVVPGLVLSSTATAPLWDENAWQVYVG